MEKHFFLKARYDLYGLCICILVLESQNWNCRPGKVIFLWRLRKFSVKFVDGHGDTAQFPGCDHGKAAEFCGLMDVTLVN